MDKDEDKQKGDKDSASQSTSSSADWSDKLAELVAWFEGNPNLPEKIGK